MAGLDEVLDRLEELLCHLEDWDAPLQHHVYELLDGVDAVHRLALHRLALLLDAETRARLGRDPMVAWLLDAYDVPGARDAGAADGPPRRSVPVSTPVRLGPRRS